MSTVRVIPVSDYAQLDVCTQFLYDAMKQTNINGMSRMYNDENLVRKGIPGRGLPVVKLSDFIDDWPVVADRERFYRSSVSLLFDEISTDDRFLRHAESGHIVSFSLTGNAHLSVEVVNIFKL